MPKHTLKKHLPDPHKIKNMRSIRWFAPQLADPRLWHLNRRSVTKATYIGLFCAFIPLPVQVVCAVAASLYFRANIALAVFLTWLTNPLTFLPTLYAGFWVGAQILGTDTLTIGQIGELIKQTTDWILAGGANPLLDKGRLVATLFFGLFVIGSITSLIGGLMMDWLWRRHVKKNWARRQNSDNQTPPSK